MLAVGSASVVFIVLHYIKIILLQLDFFIFVLYVIVPSLAVHIFALVVFWIIMVCFPFIFSACSIGGLHIVLCFHDGF